MVRLNVLSPQRQNKKDGRLSNGSGLQKDNPGFNEGVLINGSNNKAVQRGIYRERDHPSKRIRRARFLFSKTMEELSCIAQQYAWGKLGVDSEVARFKKGTVQYIFHLSLGLSPHDFVFILSFLGANDDFVVNPEAPYSELWMGTHVSGPSATKSTSESLAAYLLRNPALVGYSPKDYPSNDLAFLFKVLSIRTALSIQAHPDKALAAQLFQKFPHIYKDANHKPEMAIALTPFEAMCGFRPVSEITAFIADYPELKRILEAKAIDSLQKISDEDSMESKQEAIKALFHSFMKCDDITVNEQIRIMISRLQEKTSQERSELETLILRLHADYPNDRGVFCPLLLNTLTLKAGESFFMGANEPHAYISGDCIECMALSDNVVRAGLTPKFKDADTLMNMLHFRRPFLPFFLYFSLYNRIFFHIQVRKDVLLHRTSRH